MALVDRETFSSARGAIVELIKADLEMPPDTVTFGSPSMNFCQMFSCNNELR